MRRGDIFGANFGEPLGSEPGFRRPVLLIQADSYNTSKLATIIVLSLTSNIELRKAPGCILLTRQETGLPKDSVANVTQIHSLDRVRLDEHMDQLDDSKMVMIDSALRRVLSL